MFARSWCSIAVLACAGCTVDAPFDQGLPYACRSDAEDIEGAPQCAEGWVCVSSVCVEQATGTRASCADDLDCGERPRFCGLDFECHNPDAVGEDLAYLCNVDSDCRKGWRCGVVDPTIDAGSVAGSFSRCLDPVGERLTPEAPHARLQPPARISPVPGFSVDQLTTSNQGFGGYKVTGWTRGNVLEGYTNHDSNAEGQLNVRAPFRAVRKAVTTFAEPPLAIAATRSPTNQKRPATLALLSDGVWRVDSAGAATLIGPEFAGMTRMVIDRDDIVSAWNDDSIRTGRFSGTDTGDFGPITQDVAPAGTQFLDVYSMFHFSSGTTTMLAVTTGGLYVRTDTAGSTWAPVAIDPLWHADTACEATARPLIPTSFLSVAGDSVSLLAKPRDGSTNLQSVLLSDVTSTEAALCDAPRDTRRFKLRTPLVCPVCPDGAEFVFGHAGSTGPIAARCRTFDGPGGTSTEQTYETRGTEFNPFACFIREGLEIAAQLPLKWSRTVPSAKAFIGPEGFLFGASSASATALPITLGTAISDLRRTRSTLTAFAPARHLGTSYGDGIAFTEIEGVGLARANIFSSARPPPSSQDVDSPYGLVDRVAFDLRGWEDGGTPTVAAVLDPAVNLRTQPAFPQPLTVHSVRRPDAGTTLVVSSGDLLLSADLSGPDPTSSDGTPTLRTRLSPAPRLPIRDVAIVTTPPYALVEGYALTDSGLIHFRAYSDVRWEGQPLELVEGDTQALVTVGGRAFVGFRDGRVFSLPGRQRVAPELPGHVIYDYVSVCGRIYTATSEGLFRLEPSAMGEASWVEETGVAELLPGPSAFRKGRLFKGARELFYAAGNGALLHFVAAQGVCL